MAGRRWYVAISCVVLAAVTAGGLPGIALAASASQPSGPTAVSPLASAPPADPNRPGWVQPTANDWTVGFGPSDQAFSSRPPPPPSPWPPSRPPHLRRRRSAPRRRQRRRRPTTRTSPPRAPSLPPPPSS